MCVRTILLHPSFPQLHFATSRFARRGKYFDREIRVALTQHSRDKIITILKNSFFYFFIFSVEIITVVEPHIPASRDFHFT